MYKTYIETKHENCDRLGPSEMGQAGYLLTRPRSMDARSELSCLFQKISFLTEYSLMFQYEIDISFERTLLLVFQIHSKSKYLF